MTCSDFDNWRHARLCDLADVVMGQSPDSRHYNRDQQGKPFLQGCGEFSDYYPLPDLYCTQQTKIAPAGSVLFSVRAPVGKMNVADREYVIGRGLAAIIGNSIDQEYLRHYLASVETTFELLAQGSTFSAISGPVLKSSAVRYPIDPAAQGKIASVLSIIDKAIAQTEALITKHQRIKTAMMQDLLARGIDEHGNLRSEDNHAFKDSLLGRIPVEWEVTNMKSLAEKIVDGVHHTPTYVADGIPFVVVSDLTCSDSVDFHNTRLVSVDDHNAFIRRADPRSGDILVTKDGTLGVARIVPESAPEFSIFVSVAMIRPNKLECIPELIWSFFDSGEFLSQLAALSAGTGLSHIHLEHFREFLIRKPGLEEQRRIFYVLRQIVTPLKCLYEEAGKLRRQKTALMQDLLTGKVSVTPLLDMEAAVP